MSDAKKKPLQTREADWKASDLQLADYNPRRISKSRLEGLKRSLAADPDFMRVRRIVVNVSPTRRGVVIAGHMRLLAARELGWETVPVLEVEVDARTEKAWNVKDNHHAGEDDRARLGELVLGDPLAFEHAMPSDELDAVFNDYGPDGEGEPKKTEEQQADDIAKMKKHHTKPGDVYELGGHRLVCGDSTDPATLDKLLGTGEQRECAQMAFTDPPYNVAYGGNMKEKLRGQVRTISNDKMGAAEWSDFVAAFMAALRANVAGAVYVCMSVKEWPEVQRGFVAAGMEWRDTVVWVKDSFTMSMLDYQQQHEMILVGKPVKPGSPARVRKAREAEGEPILYGWTSKDVRRWNGGRHSANVWFFTRSKKNPVHPTQKPVELVAKAIANSSNRGDAVLDIFAGGGSTMIAAERTGRRARLVELDPGYCDAIVARYVGHTKNAKLVLNGRPIEWKGPVVTIEGVLDSLG